MFVTCKVLLPTDGADQVPYVCRLRFASGGPSISRRDDDSKAAEVVLALA